MASQGVAEKAGFRFEALARNWEVGRDDNPVDAVMFTMTPDDVAELALPADQTGGEPAAPAHRPANLPAACPGRDP